MRGVDTAVVLKNYRKDGTPFWNRVFIAPLRGVDGRIVNFVGVQTEVSEAVARVLLSSQNSALYPHVGIKTREVDPAGGAIGAVETHGKLNAEQETSGRAKRLRQ